MKITLSVLLFCSCSLLLAQNNITNTLGASGNFKVLKSDNSTEIFKVTEATSFVSTSKVAFTPEGGLAVKMVNKSGSVSKKGTIITPDVAVNNAFTIAEIASDMPCGVVYEDNVADGSDCWVVVSGIAEVLVTDGVAPKGRYVAYVGSVAGRAEEPASLTKPDASNHDKEIGHFIETKSSGIDVLAKTVIHFR